MIFNDNKYNNQLKLHQCANIQEYLRMLGADIDSPGTFQKINDHEYSCNFSSGYGDIIASLAYCDNQKKPCVLNYSTSFDITKKVKSDDAETTKDRLEFLLNNTNRNFVKVVFHTTTNKRCNLGFEKWIDKMPLLSFNKKWVGGGGYATKQLVEDNFIKQLLTHSYTLKEWRFVYEFNKNPTINTSYFKNLNYTMPIASVIDTLVKADYHIGYSGATTHLANLVGTPTIVVSNDKILGAFRNPGAYSIMPHEVDATLININIVISQIIQYKEF
jgi:hypothetical protein